MTSGEPGEPGGFRFSLRQTTGKAFHIIEGWFWALDLLGSRGRDAAKRSWKSSFGSFPRQTPHDK